MRVLPCMIILGLLCSTGAGCSLFKKNTNGTQGPGGGPPPAKFPNLPPDPLVPTPPQFPAGAKAPKASTNSILAGTVIDAYDRPMGNAYIRWVNLDEKDIGAPIDVAADANGHFIIQGVKPGGSYKLIARTKQGDKMLAGTVLTNAPDVRVVISIREDLVNASTPPLPTSPAYQAPVKTIEDKGAQGESKLETPSLPAMIGVPTNTPVSNPAGQSTTSPAFVPGVVAAPAKDRLPMLSIPSKRPEPPRPPVLPSGESKLDTGPTRVPSCVLVGSRLENLALKDSKGQTWEYKKHAAGKILLIDFWGTYCLPCRDSMPTLSRLQNQYGSRGLEVVGIALEPGKDERREAEQVSKMCTSMQLSYRQLMGRTAGFDVARDFKIDSMPTLLLLNDQGVIIYHHVGRPDPADLSTLERVIQTQLGNRKF